MHGTPKPAGCRVEGSPSRDGTASGRKPDGRALPLSCCQRTRQTPTRRPCTEPTYQPASRSPRVAFEPISSGRPLLAADTIRGDDHGPNCLGLGAQRSPHRPAGRRCASLARPATAARVLVRRATSDAHPSVCADGLHPRRRDFGGPRRLSAQRCATTSTKSRAVGHHAQPPVPTVHRPTCPPSCPARARRARREPI